MGITDVVIIYQEGDDFHCGSSAQGISTTNGLLEVVKNLI